MMYLNIKPISIDAGSAIIEWCSGKNRHGRVLISDLPEKDPQLIAELITIRHIILERNIFNRVGPIYGKGICLQTSSHEIIDLFLDSDEIEKTSFPYAKFLFRLREMKVIVKNEEDLYFPDDTPPENLSPSKIWFNPNVEFDRLIVPTASNEKAIVTRHSFYRYFTKHPEDLLPSTGFARFIKAIRSPHFEEIIINENRRRKLIENHGIHSKIYKQKYSGLTYVLSNMPGKIPEIVTVYFDNE